MVGNPGVSLTHSGLGDSGPGESEVRGWDRLGPLHCEGPGDSVLPGRSGAKLLPGTERSLDLKARQAREGQRWEGAGWSLSL